MVLFTSLDELDDTSEQRIRDVLWEDEEFEAATVQLEWFINRWRTYLVLTDERFFSYTKIWTSENMDAYPLESITRVSSASGGSTKLTIHGSGDVENTFKIADKQAAREFSKQLQQKASET